MRRIALATLVSAVAWGTGCSSSHPPASCDIPQRPALAITGSAFREQIDKLPPAEREQRILDEITAGNVPPFLRSFVPVTVTATIDGTTHSATYYVAPDYLAVGTDADFFRIPMRPQTAQAVADRFGCILPTRKMVNDIYARAAVKLAPSPIGPKTTDITQVATFWQHQLAVEQQRAGQPLGRLVGGIKKDVVVTSQLAAKPGKVAIYGWHQLDGKPIQPLYLGHVNWWVDYSQCIRLIANRMTLDGKTVPIADVLHDPKLSLLLSDEGPVPHPRY